MREADRHTDSSAYAQEPTGAQRKSGAGKLSILWVPGDLGPQRDGKEGGREGGCPSIHLSPLWTCSGSSPSPLPHPRSMSASQVIRYSNSHSCPKNSLQITPFPCN